MTLGVFLIVLCAAVLHASWNAMVKSDGNKVVSMTAVTLGHAPLAVLALPFLPLPDKAALPYLVASVLVHCLYQLSLMVAYRLGEFTQVYPIARGSGPALVTLVSISFLGVELSFWQLCAIGLVVLGIFSLTLVRQSDGLRNPKAVGAALITGCLIATYSLLDGFGGRISGHAVSYVAWMTTANAVFFAIFMGIFNREALIGAVTTGRRTLILGGSGSVLAYALVVWAMSQAPIPLVTALRETSTIFALLIGAFFLKEHITRGKVIATCLTLSGVLLMRVAGG